MTVSQRQPTAPAMRGQALRAALKFVPAGHHGSPHPTGYSFQYEPNQCPGCVYAILREMIREVEGGD